VSAAKIFNRLSHNYQNLYAIVKRRVGFENASFYTKAGEEIAARRGGIQVRKDFFNSVLAELEDYER